MLPRILSSIFVDFFALSIIQTIVHIYGKPFVWTPVIIPYLGKMLGVHSGKKSGRESRISGK